MKEKSMKKTKNKTRFGIFWNRRIRCLSRLYDFVSKVILGFHFFFGSNIFSKCHKIVEIENSMGLQVLRVVWPLKTPNPSFFRKKSSENKMIDFSKKVILKFCFLSQNTIFSDVQTTRTRERKESFQWKSHQSKALDLSYWLSHTRNISFAKSKIEFWLAGFSS